jgi:ankyrin repeat protein
MAHGARFLLVFILTIPCLAQETELFEAAREGDLTKLKTLTGNRATVNLRGAHSRTALHEAGANCQLEAFKLLVDAGWDRFARDDEGSTPDMYVLKCPNKDYAALSGNKQVIELLLAHGADLNAVDTESASTPLHYAASFGRLEAVKALVQHGADVSLKTAGGLIPIQLAISNNQEEVSTFLRDTGSASSRK